MPSKHFSSFAQRLNKLYGSTQQFSRYFNNACFRVSDEIQDAIASHKPVVALESTIYTHGFPYPENLALASKLEFLVRSNGGAPATIGVFNGVAKVGLSSEELTQLISSTSSAKTLKISRRDLPHICGLGLLNKCYNGGTTVAATAVLAQKAGISVFATGGLGGVHRGGENSMDISADLVELGRTPIAVVSSGCKSFLDIGKTLEYLETQGVYVGTFADGRGGDVDVPAFFSRDSGFQSPYTIENEEVAASIIRKSSTLVTLRANSILQEKFSLWHQLTQTDARNLMQLKSGLLFANPVPQKQEIPRAEMAAVIDQALHEAKENDISGSRNTPFILSRIRELSKGRTVTANKALVEANVICGTRIAVELSKLQNLSSEVPYLNPRDEIDKASQSIGLSDQNLRQPNQEYTVPITSPIIADKTDIFVAGSLAIDVSCNLESSDPKDSDQEPLLKTSNPAAISQNLGGVGYNIALAAYHFGATPRLCSIIAKDVPGQTVLESLSNSGLDTSAVLALDADMEKTSQYVAVNDRSRDLFVAMADMRIMESSSVDFHQHLKPQLIRSKPNWMVLDGNWSPNFIHEWIGTAGSIGCKVAFEPVSIAKSTKIFTAGSQKSGRLEAFPKHRVAIMSPNQMELASMHDAARDLGFFDLPDWWTVVNALEISNSGARDRLVRITNTELVNQGVPQQSIQLVPFFPCIVTKLGSRGVLHTELLQKEDPRLTSPEAAPFVVSRSSDAQNQVGGLYMRLHAAPEVLDASTVQSVNGAGDTFLGVLIAGLALSKASKIEELIETAQRASIMTLKSQENASADISKLRGFGR